MTSPILGIFMYWSINNSITDAANALPMYESFGVQNN